MVDSGPTTAAAAEPATAAPPSTSTLADDVDGVTDSAQPVRPDAGHGGCGEPRGLDLGPTTHVATHAQRPAAVVAGRRQWHTSCACGHPHAPPGNFCNACGAPTAIAAACPAPPASVVVSGSGQTVTITVAPSAGARAGAARAVSTGAGASAVRRRASLTAPGELKANFTRCPQPRAQLALSRQAASGVVVVHTRRHGVPQSASCHGTCAGRSAAGWVQARESRGRDVQHARRVVHAHADATTALMACACTHVMCAHTCSPAPATARART